MDDLLRDYNKYMRPVQNQSAPVTIYVQPYVKSIQEFDEVREMFSFVGAFGILWLDETMQWRPEDYGGLNQISMPYISVWVPELILSSPSDEVEKLGRKWNKVKYYYSGLAMWLPVNLIKSTCAVSVQHYPFDSQSCVTSFNTLGYDSAELLIEPSAHAIDMTIYQENSIWEITNTSVTVADKSQLDCTFYLKRKPSFVIINILLPILFLSLLNVLVFLLVPKSGERASYCITVLLSIAVFMTTVSDLLPRSSQPVPTISFKLMVDMVISSLIVLMTILNLRIYSKANTEPAPKWLQKLYCFLTCVWCTRPSIRPVDTQLKTYLPMGNGEKGNAIGPRTKTLRNINVKSLKTVATMVKSDQEKVPIEPTPTEKMVDLTEEILKRQKITWKKISFMVDGIALVVFTLLSLISFGVFMISTSTQSI